ncbi:hypothetical protein Xmir_04427 [Xenorhabdus miraniensis]|uniref:Uncharacterized protein n=1 Tax=Xenorhabdus miraniensis TaxID=351674 RepID=A0A2D0J743_9GAMM|nr:hypothetical protein Xmir_04427 [Xenorhabdus miraniensis]
MTDTVQPVVPVFPDFRRHIAVPQAGGAQSRPFAHFFRAPPERVVAVIPLLAARRQYPDKLVLAVPPELGELSAVAFLPQLHRGHPPGLIILEQVLTQLP